jgi:DNA-directed RNA polymerase specialized sigma subunit
MYSKILSTKTEGNVMTAKEYLWQCIDLDARIKSKHQRIAMLKDRATRTTGIIKMAKVSGTPINNQLEDAVCKYVDLQAELADDIERFVSLQREVSDVIERIENTDLRTVLEYRYLSMCSWDEIARKMNFCSRWIMRLHDKALKAIEIQFPSVI